MGKKKGRQANKNKNKKIWMKINVKPAVAAGGSSNTITSSEDAHRVLQDIL